MHILERLPLFSLDICEKWHIAGHSGSRAVGQLGKQIMDWMEEESYEYTYEELYAVSYVCF